MVLPVDNFWVSKKFIRHRHAYFSNVFIRVCVFYFSQMRMKKKNKVEMRKKSINLVAKPMFTNPSSTPVTTATQTMKSLWRSGAGLR